MSGKEEMLCHEVRVELSALLAGDLDAETRAAVERHLSFCPGCQFEWRDHEVVWRCLTRCEDVEPPVKLKERVMEEIEQHERKQRQKKAD